jgi:transcriptional regulator with XRE-family HTH domain
MEKVKHILRPVIDLQQTGEKIKSLRKFSGFSVHELQDLFGFEYPQAIYAWESGKSIPTVDNLLVLARLFDVTLDDLICYSLVEVSRNCSVHVANCMNKAFVTCQNCKFKKSA